MNPPPTFRPPPPILAPPPRGAPPKLPRPAPPPPRRCADAGMEIISDNAVRNNKPIKLLFAISISRKYLSIFFSFTLFINLSVVSLFCVKRARDTSQVN
jgi:hypothetical protein